MSQKYAFIDRDGVLIYEPSPEETPKGEIPYQIDSVKKLKILAGVIDGLKKLTNLGYKLIMVSNQNGIGTDKFPLKAFETPQNRMLEIFENDGIEFYKIFICPHFPEDNCNCRKPKTGLVNEFLQTTDIDLDNSFMIGDRESDMLFAKNIGVRGIQAKTNSNSLYQFTNQLKP